MLLSHLLWPEEYHAYPTFIPRMYCNVIITSIVARKYHAYPTFILHMYSKQLYGCMHVQPSHTVHGCDQREGKQASS